MTETFTPELGQWGFSNTEWQQHETPEFVTLGLRVLADAIALKTGVTDEWSRITENSGGQFANDTFALRAYCWCDGEAAGHEDGCPPNFEHRESGLVATWYKHASRSASINRVPNSAEWMRVFMDCMTSLELT